MIKMCVQWVFVIVCLFQSPVFADEPAAAPKDENPPINQQDELVRIRTQEFNLMRDLEDTKASKIRNEKRWEEARDKMDNSDADDPVLVELLTHINVLNSLATERKKVIEQRLAYLDQSRDLVKKLNRIQTKHIARATLKVWNKQASDWLGVLEQDQHLVMGKIREITTDIQAMQNRLDKETMSPGEQRWVKKTIVELTNHANMFRTVNDELKAYRKRAQYLRDLINQQLNTSPWRQKYERVKDKLNGVLAHEISQDKGYSVTLGKVLAALILLVLGLILSKKGSVLTVRSLSKKMHVSKGNIDAMQKLLFYFFVLLFSYFAFKVVNIPLTMFAFLGGAVALGVGFGSQNILNNFISGIILLIERPVKTGDYVEVDSILGEVEYIGMRSTRVRTPDNIHLVVPNSSFLEKNVTNWTLSDKIIRTAVDVGVAYGSPTDRVRDLVLEVAEAHENVLNYPKPIVLFIDFGDNALGFRLYFWMRVDRLIDRFKIQSDIRYQMDEVFRREHITIAYPQRDVHLNSLSPLEIKLLKED